MGIVIVMQAFRQPVRSFARSVLNQSRNASHGAIDSSALGQAAIKESERAAVAARRVKFPDFDATMGHLKGRVCKIDEKFDEFWPLYRAVALWAPLYFLPKFFSQLWEDE
eukprot:GDKJ01042275.1.p1 GENE.GDKJ01042275.1~~GDKJ01042275.1.p1  ORF type:complete len:110 (-),score=29.33 GDKJ01042275.1:106-435(-)